MDTSIIVYAAAKTFGVPAAILVAMCTQESGLRNITVPNDGGTPSHGICQVKLGTVDLLKAKYKIKKHITAEQLEQPRINAAWAALYLKYQLENNNNDLCRAVPSYNAGSFIESKRYPGSAVNYKYIEDVRRHLSDDLKYMLACPRKEREKPKKEKKNANNVTRPRVQSAEQEVH